MSASPPSHRNLGPIPRGTIGIRENAADPQHRDRYHHFAGLWQAPGPASGGAGAPLSDTTRLALARLIDDVRWSVGTPGALNDRLPAGYTYLFQLAAHDMTQTALSQGGTQARNLRRAPLMLETVFGGGSAVCPFAFDRDPHGLRLGPVRSHQANAWTTNHAIQRDLPRLAWGRPDGTSPETVLIPDPRNDDNLLLGQLTLLFHRIYNHIVRALPPAGTAADEELAQAVMARLWRRIIRKDLLARLMHPAIYPFYATPTAPLDTDSVAGIPSLEFAFAIGRTGHALVRDSYRMNASDQADLETIINTSASHDPRRLPLLEKYVVDWSFFFDIGPATQPDPRPDGFNLAFRFGPHVATAMLSASAAAALNPGDPHGTTFRDLMREHSGNLAPVRSLAARVIARWPPGNDWPDALGTAILNQGIDNLVREGLERMHQRAPKAPALTAGQQAEIIANPPLSLFLQIEAEGLGDAGRSLGPLGSILLAESMRLAIADPLARNRDLHLAEVQALGAEAETVPELLALLRRKDPNFLSQPSHNKELP